MGRHPIRATGADILTTSRPVQRLSDEDPVRLLELAKKSDSVQSKLTVPASGQRAAVTALGAGSSRGADPPGVLLRHPRPRAQWRRGRRARSQSPGEGCSTRSSSCARSFPTTCLTDTLRKSSGFVVEVDAMPGGYVCSAALKGKADSLLREAGSSRTASDSEALSKEQRAFFAPIVLLTASSWTGLPCSGRSSF